MPDFSKKYPATLHINIDKGHRESKIGTRLSERYLSFLKDSKIKGVHFGTISEGAKRFFTKAGFDLLFESKRSYLRYYFKRDTPFYIFGKAL